jgi:hypothetical protein
MIGAIPRDLIVSLYLIFDFDNRKLDCADGGQLFFRNTLMKRFSYDVSKFRSKEFVNFRSRIFVKINEIFSDFCVSSINNTFLAELHNRLIGSIFINRQEIFKRRQRFESKYSEIATIFPEMTIIRNPASWMKSILFLRNPISL